jgi:hypothetical protein
MLLPSAKRNRTDQGFDGLSSGTISGSSSSVSASTSAAASAAASSESSLPSEMEDGRDNSDGDALVEQWSRAQTDLGCTVCRQLLCRPITLPCGCSCCQVRIVGRNCLIMWPRPIGYHRANVFDTSSLLCWFGRLSSIRNSHVRWNAFLASRISLSHTRFAFSRSTACMPRRPCMRAAAPR